MKLNREEVIKSLECCGCVGIPLHDCKSCHYNAVEYCRHKMAQDCLALIKELAEENEKLNERLDREAKCQYDLATKIVDLRDDIKYVKADTVQKMQTLFKERLDISVCEYSTEEVVDDVLETLDRVAEEILEKNK